MTALSELPADQAIPRLLDEHGPRIYAFASRLCGNPDEAEDLMQEVMLNAWRKWHQFEGRSRPETWLYTIAAHACQRMHRLRAGEPRHLQSLDSLEHAPLDTLLPRPEQGVADVDAALGGPLADALRHEAMEAVERGLAALPPEFRMALVLKDIAELSTAEVAEVLGIPQNTVKTRVHRGRLRLRQVLAEALPQRDAPPPDHPRQVCLTLLQAKQEALDHGVELPLATAELCSRCRALFRTLDLARDTCQRMGRGELPPAIARLAARPPGQAAD